MRSTHLIASRSMIIALVCCFFLPFVTVSCTRYPSKVTLSGINMVTGTAIRIDSSSGSRTSGDWAPPRSEMIAAFVIAIAMLIPAFLKISARIRSVILFVGAVLGFLFFFILKSAFDNEIRMETRLLLTYEAGFWMSWFLFTIIAILNLFMVFQMTLNKPSHSQIAAVTNGTALFCPQCGSPITDGSPKFCMNCGKALPQNRQP